MNPLIGTILFLAVQAVLWGPLFLFLAFAPESYPDERYQQGTRWEGQ